MRLHQCALDQPSVFCLFVACLFTLVASTVFSPTAHADLVEYAIAKELAFQQTADNVAPTVLDHAEMFANVFVDNASDFSSVSLNGGAGMTYSAVNGGFDWEGSQSFSSQSAMDAAFPNGTTFTINASGGTLGSFNESITFNASHVFPDTPFFTGTVFSDAQGLDPSQAFTFTWDTPPADGFELFIEEVGGNQVFGVDGFGGSTDTSATVTAGTFSVGTDYRAHIVFFDVFEGTRDSFSTGTELTGFVSQTSFQFTTASVPEPSSSAIMAVSLIGIAARRRSRTKA